MQQQNSDQNQKQPFPTICGTKFNTNTSQAVLEEFKEFGQNQIWELNEQYQTIDCHQILSSIQQTNVRQLHLGENNNPNIIADITEIKFTNLKILGLSENRISTIQPISRMIFPFLEGINLFDNCLTSIKSLRRINCPHLFVLSLQDNFITDFSPLSEMPFQSTLRQIGVNYMQYTLCSDSLSWFMKLQNRKFSQLWIGQYNRIKVQKILLVAQNKFVHANIIRIN